MSPLKISLVVAVASALVTAGALYRHQQGRAREVRHLQAQNGRLRLEANQRVHRQAAVAQQPNSTPEVVATELLPAPATAAQAPDYYRNEGNATPRATLQTFAWACDRGDIAM